MGAFAKLGLGFSPPTPVDAEAFLRQFTPATPDDLIESPSHPDFPKRSHALKLFSNSEVYQSLVGGSGERPINELETLFSDIAPEVPQIETAQPILHVENQGQNLVKCQINYEQFCSGY